MGYEKQLFCISTPMKTWLRGSGISYRRLTTVMGQLAPNTCSTANTRMCQPANNLLKIYAACGLSADFVLGVFVILEARAMHPAGSAFRSLDTGGGTS